MRLFLAILVLAVAASCDFSMCPACEGKGTIRCTLCTLGKQDCAMCVNGSTDSGLPCKFCRGEGMVGCQACKGEGATSCRHCKGTGKR